MDEDTKVEIYNKGFKQGQLHQKTAPDTDRRLKSLEESILGEIKPSISELATNFRVFVQETQDYHEQQCKTQQKILEQTTAHNSRMTKIELWKATLDGGKLALKGVWGVIGAFVIAGVIAIFAAMFQMYVMYQNLPNIISAEVTSQLGNYQFEIVE